MDKHNSTDTSATAQRAVASGPLVRRITLLETALQSIMDETEKHFEWNPESKTARLPNGYRKILNTAHAALNAPNPANHARSTNHENTK